MKQHQTAKWKAYKKEWDKNNREKLRAYMRKYYWNHVTQESARKKQYWIDSRDKLLARQKKYRKENKEKLYQYFKKYCKENRMKTRARSRVCYALKTGKLIKKSCFCGESKTEAHHKDYNHPLDVEWYCRIHHIEMDKKHDKSKLEGQSIS